MSDLMSMLRIAMSGAGHSGPHLSRNSHDRQDQRTAGSRLAVTRVLASTLILLLGVSFGRNAAAASPEAPQDVPTFTYELYCDAQGRFTYDGAAVKLVRRPLHLERVYADAKSGDARAKELVRELEYWFYQAGVVVADTTTRPACLPLPEMTLECQPNWKFLQEFLGDTHEADRLRQVVAHAYEVRTRERGLQNKVIVAGVNLLLVGGVVKGLTTQVAAVEARGAARQVLATEAKVTQVEALAAGRGGVVAGGATQAFGGLSRAAEFGLKPYGQLRQALRGTGLKAHHLIEQRFAGVMGQNARQMVSVALTPAEHQVFTNRWRELIPYGPGSTGAATREAVLGAARQVYADYPEILRALGL